jgi:hypothetical protein
MVCDRLGSEGPTQMLTFNGALTGARAFQSFIFETS